MNIEWLAVGLSSEYERARPAPSPMCILFVCHLPEHC